MSHPLKGTPYLDTIGLQLWTVREQLQTDPKGTLERIAAYGYKQIELMDTVHIPDVIPLGRDLGLEVKSSFINWTLLTGRWDLRDIPNPGYDFEFVVEQAASSGLDHLVFGYMLPDERKSLDDYRRICDQLNRAQLIAAKADIQLCYHNHNFEFSPMEGSNGFEVLIGCLDPNGVKFELDVFWASLAGADPLKLMQRLTGRVGLLHLKDKLADAEVIYDESQVPPETFKELGAGVVDLEPILLEAELGGVTYCMVEQDFSTDPVKSVGISMGWLKNL